MMCYWDGIVHFIMYLMMISRITDRWVMVRIIQVAPVSFILLSCLPQITDTEMSGAVILISFGIRHSLSILVGNFCQSDVLV